MVDLTEEEINDAYKRITKESQCGKEVIIHHYITLEDVIKANNDMIKKYKNRDTFKKFCKKLYKHNIKY